MPENLWKLSVSYLLGNSCSNHPLTWLAVIEYHTIKCIHVRIAQDYDRTVWLFYEAGSRYRALLTLNSTHDLRCRFGVLEFCQHGFPMPRVPVLWRYPVSDIGYPPKRGCSNAVGGAYCWSACHFAALFGYWLILYPGPERSGGTSRNRIVRLSVRTIVRNSVPLTKCNI